MSTDFPWKRPALVWELDWALVAWAVVPKAVLPSPRAAAAPRRDRRPMAVDSVSELAPVAVCASVSMPLSLAARPGLPTPSSGRTSRPVGGGGLLPWQDPGARASAYRDGCEPTWIEPAFDRRFAGIRILVLAGVMVGYFLLLQRPSGARDWGLAAAGLVLCLAAGSWVFGALLAQSVLLVAAHTVGAGTVASLKVLAAVTLFELAVQQSGRRLAARATTLALAVAVNRFEDLPGEILSVLYKMGIVAGLPLLLGAYVRVTRDAAVHARRHAEQQELRAEQQLLAARAAERTTIARELHDLVAHHVSSMVLRVGVARHVTAATGTTAPRITAVLDDLHASAGAALTDLRRLVAVLRAPRRAAGRRTWPRGSPPRPRGPGQRGQARRARRTRRADRAGGR